MLKNCHVAFKINKKGQIILEVKDKNIGAFYLTDKYIYALISDGTINVGGVCILDKSGNIIKKSNEGGFDIIVDENNSMIWVVGEKIKKLDLNLNLIFEKKITTWTATSVDIGENGNIWVGVGQHPEIPSSRDCIYQVSSLGDVIQKINLRDRPNCVRFDSKNKNLWIVCPSGTFLFKTSNNELLKIDNKGAFSLEIDYQNNFVWVAGGNSLRKYSLEGSLILTKNLKPRTQRYIGLSKTK